MSLFCYVLGKRLKKKHIIKQLLYQKKINTNNSRSYWGSQNIFVVATTVLLFLTQKNGCNNWWHKQW